MEDLTVCIPSFNESHDTITKTVAELKLLGAEVIVVDDGSDSPFPDAFKHGANFGYGAALMTGIKNATRPLILTMDGDGQHTTSEAVKLYHAFKLMQDADMVIGVRRLNDEKIHRFLGRKFLNWTASLLCTFWIPDLNSGARIFKRDIAISYFSILCRTFSFTTSLTISMMADNRRVEWFPIKVVQRVDGKSRVKVWKDGWVTLKYIIWIGLGLRTRKLRHFMRGIRLWNWLTGKGFVALP